MSLTPPLYNILSRMGMGRARGRRRLTPYRADTRLRVWGMRLKIGRASISILPLHAGLGEGTRQP